jgi:cytochrome c-type biogenesis protein CcmH
MNPAPWFWIAVAALVAVSLFALVWPLLRTPRRVGPREDDAMAAVYRDHRRQLDADRDAGTIGADEHARAVDELVRRFGAELAEAPPAQPAALARTPWVAALALVAIVPAAALALYFMLGAPEALRVRGAVDASHPVSQAEIVAMVESLAARMRADPGNPEGWLLLARSYAALGRYQDSADAYAAAAKLVGDDAQIYADWADALAMAQGRTLAGRPTELIDRALAIDPKNRKALALAATVRYERGDYEGALARWRELKAIVPPNSEEARQVDDVIAEVEARRGKGTLAQARPGGAASQASQSGRSAQSGKSAAPSREATPTQAAAPGRTVSGRVELDSTLKGKIGQSDALFIYARAVNGPRMPLAVLRGSAAELPKSFTLDDSMAMSPAMKLSSAESVIVEARVSKSGNATPQPGDLRGASAPVVPGSANIRVVIRDVVP